jgi:hypothetical protein
MIKQFLGRTLGVALVVMNLGLAGCAAGGQAAVAPLSEPTAAATLEAAAVPATPTAAASAAPDAPAATPIPAEVAVVDVRVLRNALGQALVAGTVVNGTAAPVHGIELEVRASDAAGDTLLKDGWGSEPADSATFAPLAESLAQGESSPFAYTIYEGEPAEFTVTVMGYGEASDVVAQAVALEHAQFATDVLGEQHLLGEAVNAADTPVSIQSLYVAVYDAGGALLTVEDADILVRQLDAAGTAGASAPLDISLGALPGEPETYAVYATTAAAEPSEVSLAIAERFHSYFDTAGGAHLVGMIGNSGDTPVSADLTAGLYDADGVVLDRSGGGLYWLRLPAGAAVPYDFSDFSLVESVPELAGRVSRYTVQFDPQYTRAEEVADIALSTTGDALAADGESWEASGSVVNSSDQLISRVVAIAALHDAEGNPVVVGFKVLDSFEGPGLGAGEQIAYQISLDADAALDPAELTLKTYVYGSPAS